MSLRSVMRPLRSSLRWPDRRARIPKKNEDWMTPLSASSVAICDAVEPFGTFTTTVPWPLPLNGSKSA